ncbi:MAG: FHA domain-containing protein [Anaerolineae bacterium]|nr:FHA domain-containing protein [Anaerolineae bacterium]
MPSSLFVGGAHLIALHGDVQPPEYQLETDFCTIGRSADCDVVVARPIVSRLHARIERRGSHYVLHDLSRNRTYVNEIPVHAPHILRDRETIGLALPEPLLLFQDSDPTAEPHPSRLHYDEKQMTFWLDDRRLSLTRLELRLLYHLYQNAGQPCGYEECGQAAWGEDYSSDLLVDNLGKIVYRVRKKLSQIDPDCDLIETRRGIGYVLKD